jgi:hypothetical protein
MVPADGEIEGALPRSASSPIADPRVGHLMQLLLQLEAAVRS